MVPSNQQVMLRIASLIPSGTDLTAALGFADCLVGVSHECDHPDAGDLPVLTSSFIPPATVDGPSLAPAEIDRLVCESVQAGESLYITDRTLLHGLAPNIVVSQDVCDVCAVNAEAAACDIPSGAELVLLTAISIDGLVADITTLAASLGAPDRGEAVVAEVRAGLALSRGVAAVPEVAVTVVTLEAADVIARLVQPIHDERLRVIPIGASRISAACAVAASPGAIRNHPTR